MRKTTRRKAATTTRRRKASTVDAPQPREQVPHIVVSHNTITVEGPHAAAVGAIVSLADASAGHANALREAAITLREMGGKMYGAGIHLSDIRCSDAKKDES